MSRLQHLGWFFSSGFRPQAWGRPEHRWGYRWQEPRLYQHSVRELEQAGLDLVVMEDAVSLGSPDTLDLRVRAAYGGPKHDPLLLATPPAGTPASASLFERYVAHRARVGDPMRNIEYETVADWVEPRSGYGPGLATRLRTRAETAAPVR